MKLSDGSILTFSLDGENLRVDASKPACGKSFEGVARILAPKSKVPAIQIERGLGLEAVEAILNFAKEYQETAK